MPLSRQPLRPSQGTCKQEHALGCAQACLKGCAHCTQATAGVFRIALPGIGGRQVVRWASCWEPSTKRKGSSSPRTLGLGPSPGVVCYKKCCMSVSAAQTNSIRTGRFAGMFYPHVCDLHQELISMCSWCKTCLRNENAHVLPT